MVRAKDRTESSMEFLANLVELRKQFTEIIKRDFILKDERMRNCDDGNIKVEVGRFYEEPDWLIKDIREALIKGLRELASNTITANNIYVYSQLDKDQRINLFSKAIGSCNMLLQEMYYMKQELNFEIDKYKRIIDLIYKQIRLLKGCRQQTNKIVIKGNS